MIEQLQAPRTRSLTRNLVIRAAEDPASHAAPSAPSVVESSPSAQAQAQAKQATRPALSLQIQFAFDSARLLEASSQSLVNLAQALQSEALREANFLVEGHTDAKGSAEYNLRLSAQRAASVRDFLVSQGVQASRLQTRGRGSSEPADADPLAAVNRRVRIVNLD